MSSRAVKTVEGVVATILVAWLCIYAYQNVEVVRLDNLYETKYGYPPGRGEEYFGSSFPSSSAIETYVQDSTFVYSKPPRENHVYYFDRNHTYVSWFEGVTNGGEWKTFPKVQILILGSRWRMAVVNVFCMLNVKMDAGHCYDVEETESLLRRGPGSSADYYRRGNVFDLSSRKRALFSLPRSEITIDSLLSSIHGNE